MAGDDGGEKETKKVTFSGKLDDGDIRMIAEIEERFNLNKRSLDMGGKYTAMCLMFGEAVNENKSMKELMKSLEGQLEKQTQTREALQKLIDALKSQITLTKEEGELKLKEETQKRIEVSRQFQSTMEELTSLMESNTTQNSKLREENASLAEQMTTLIGQYEHREKEMASRTEEYVLQTKLFETQLAKAKIEKAEMNADFTRERLELHRSLLDANEQRDSAASHLRELKENVEVYEKQYKDLEKSIKEGGAGGGQKQTFETFRKEMERLGKKLRSIERESADWREKFDSSNDQVKKMNADSMEREKELAATKKKLQAMENLNRALQEERAKMLKQKKNGVADEQSNGVK